MRFLFMALGACAVVTLHGCGCTLVACEDEVNVQGEIGVALSERLHVDIWACRNGVCSHGVLTFELSELSSGNIHVAQLEGAAAVSCNGTHQNRQFWSLACDFRPDDGAGSFEDGDRIELRVIDLDTGEVEVDLSESVDYAESSPNGEWCGPHCDYAVIELEPPS